MSSSGVPKTPKKVYKSVGGNVLNCCRLCKSFGDVSHWKNLFGKGNRALLAAAENIHGNTLLRSESLPHLLCRPCERRLNNFIVSKSTIIEAQKSLNTGERISPLSLQGKGRGEALGTRLILQVLLRMSVVSLTSRPGLLEAWLMLTSVKYYGNL